MTSVETNSETTDTSKTSHDVIDEANKEVNKHAEAEVGGSYKFVEAKVSGGIAEKVGSSSKDTKTNLNETMAKTASKIKHDTKVTVSTESESTYEDTSAAELVNPNDEMAITYVYSRLQQQFWVTTEVGGVDSVVFVPQAVPAWEDIDEDWVRGRGDVLARALLDPSYAGILAAIRSEPSGLAYTATGVYDDAARAGINAAKDYQAFSGGGAMPDLLASGQMYYERDFERRNNREFDNKRRAHQAEALLLHIRRNILHYMRALWADEDYDQRLQRYSKMRVPTAWVFVPHVPTSAPATPMETEGVFMPVAGSARPLTDVIDPIGPIGYWFNCAIYRVRDDVRQVNLHQALAYLRAAYTKFTCEAKTSAGSGVTVRLPVAYAPRSFSDTFDITYRSARGKWLLSRAGKPENEWFELFPLADGGFDVRGVRIWVDGQPADHATVTVSVRSTGELEDPHLRLLRLTRPLPASADEAALFSDDLLAEMLRVLPGLAGPGQLPAQPSWGALSDTRKQQFREAYHRFLLLSESGRLIPLDTANLVLDLDPGASPALEPFKRLHRFVDVVKEVEEYEHRHLENVRRAALLDVGRLSDPDIERVTVVGDGVSLKDLVITP